METDLTTRPKLDTSVPPPAVGSKWRMKEGRHSNVAFTITAVTPPPPGHPTMCGYIVKTDGVAEFDGISWPTIRPYLVRVV